jgi:hypothetical protein
MENGWWFKPDTDEPPDMPEQSGVDAYLALRDAHVARTFVEYRGSKRARFSGFAPTLEQGQELYRQAVMRLQWECATNPQLAGDLSLACVHVASDQPIVGMGFNPFQFLISPIVNWLLDRIGATGFKRFCLKLFLEVALSLLIMELFTLLADRRVGTGADPMNRLSGLASLAAAAG